MSSTKMLGYVYPSHLLRLLVLKLANFSSNSTLIIIVMRAKNLPNLVKIGKQNPFATVSYGGAKKKTTTIDRGGQAPEWDEEFRFEIPEDMETVEIPEGAKVSKTGGLLPAIPAGEVPQVGKVLKSSSSSTSIAPKNVSIGLKHLRLACYADDVRDPKLIGEVMVELAPIIKKGTSDRESILSDFTDRTAAGG